MEKALNFIAGEFQEAVERKWLTIDDPSTGELVTELADSGIMDVVACVQASNRALVAWLKTDAVTRAKKLSLLADRIEARADALGALESRETGVTVQHAKEISVPRAVETLRYFVRLLLDESAPALVNPRGYFLQNRLPIGTVVAICSYSDPLLRICTAIAAAIAGGNALILKASSRTPLTAQAIAEAVKEAEFPAGVFNLLQGRGEEVGRALVNHPGLSTLSFTGRTEVAREIQASAAEFLKRTQLSLSGSNAVLVFAENDLEKLAPKVAQVVFAHQGSVAERGARVLIQESVYDRFLELLKIELANVKVGPIVKPQDFEQFSKAVSQAIKERAKPLGGAIEAAVSAKGRFVQPVALYDLTFCSTLQQEEVIGPIATVGSFKYQHDAIKHANNSPFGQVAYVFHAQPAKAAKIAMKIEAGRVFVGGGPSWDVRASSGGLKTSGQGQAGALASLRFFTRETLVSFDISG